MVYNGYGNLWVFVGIFSTFPYSLLVTNTEEAMECLIMPEIFKTAVEKANEVLTLLQYTGQDMVDTNAVKAIVEKMTNTTVKIGEMSFSELDRDFVDYGAMMRVEKDSNDSSGHQLAYIVLNKDKDTIFKRFSLMHELGHLATGKYNYSNDEGYTISAHIHYKLNSVPISDDCADEDLINEQIANIFALLVLIPKDNFEKNINDLDSIKEIAKFYGITPEAVVSRIRLGV